MIRQIAKLTLTAVSILLMNSALYAGDLGPDDSHNRGFVGGESGTLGDRHGALLVGGEFLLSHGMYLALDGTVGEGSRTPASLYSDVFLGGAMGISCHFKAGSEKIVPFATVGVYGSTFVDSVGNGFNRHGGHFAGAGLTVWFAEGQKYRSGLRLEVRDSLTGEARGKLYRVGFSFSRS